MQFIDMNPIGWLLIVLIRQFYIIAFSDVLSVNYHFTEKHMAVKKF